MENDMTTTLPEQNRALVLKAFDTLFNKRDYVTAELLVRPLYTTWRCASTSISAPHWAPAQLLALLVESESLRRRAY
jgi:hypothetical protein